MKIFLIGMPGSGKSTFGKQLAGKMATPFIDLDKEIEKTAGKSVQDIFAESGETSFRELEAKQLRETSSTHHSFVMATGGGTPCFHQSLEYMKQQGKTVFLDTPLDVIFSRVKTETNRPLLALETDEQVMNRLRKLHETRLPFYHQADICIPMHELSEARVIDALLKKGNQG